MGFLNKVIVIATLVLSLNAEEFYLQPDKQKHFIGSMAIGSVATGIARYYGSNKVEAMVIGIGSALLVGVLKEAVDGKGYGTEDIGDVYADTLGSIAGSVIATNFSWKF